MGASKQKNCTVGPTQIIAWHQHPSVHSSVCPPNDRPKAKPDRLQAQPDRSQVSQPGPASQASGPASQDGRTDRRMYVRNLPILQDFVPYRGRCPASQWKFQANKEQGKGTADHLMPLGDWFSPLIYCFYQSFITFLYFLINEPLLLLILCFYFFHLFIDSFINMISDSHLPFKALDLGISATAIYKIFPQ